MKKLRYFLLLLGIAGLASCQGELFSEKTDENGLVLREYVVSGEEVTKAYIDANVKIAWEEGDKFSVYDPVGKTAREFTVSSVTKEGRAKISGYTSPGNYNVSFVYPSSAVKQWTSSTTYTANVPESQTIASGRTIDPAALVCGAFDVDDSGLITMKPLSSLVKFTLGRDDIETVILAVAPSKGSYTEYRVDCSGARKFAKGSYYAMVAPGEYAGGVKVVCRNWFWKDYTKTTSNKLSLVKGHIVPLGTVSDGTESQYYELTLKDQVSSADELMNIMVPKFNVSQDKLNEYANIIDAAMDALPDTRNTPMDSYVLKYKSTDVDGTPVTLSGRVHLLRGVTKMKGIMLYNHYSMCCDADCPSNTFFVEAAGTYIKYAVFAPDFYGFGASVDKPQAYINTDLVAQGNIDGFKIFKKVLSDRGITYEDNVYNCGYSQGGAVSIANLKYVANHSDAGITFTKTFAGGGPYNFQTCYDHYTAEEDKYSGASCYFALGLVNLIETDKLDVNYANILKEPLLSNYKDWYLSKKYSTGTIVSHIGTKLSGIVTADVMNQTGTDVQILKNQIAKYNLCSGWKLPSGSKVYIYQSKEDDIAPYQNLEQIRSFLGEDSSLKIKLHTATRYYNLDEDGGDHIDALAQFGIWLIKGDTTIPSPYIDCDLNWTALLGVLAELI